MEIFLKNMSTSDKTIQQLKKATRGQSENELWYQLCLGGLTASNHHNIFMNCVVKSIGPIKQKTTPLVSQIISGGPKQATTWGIQIKPSLIKDICSWFYFFKIGIYYMQD